MVGLAAAMLLAQGWRGAEPITQGLAEFGQRPLQAASAVAVRHDLCSPILRLDLRREPPALPAAGRLASLRPAWYAACSGRRRTRRFVTRSARMGNGGKVSTTLAMMVLGFSAPASALDEVTFGTNWKAEAEHGGFYQAVADGTYERHGLKVTIRPGGPQVNHSQLLAAGRIDFNMGGNLFEQFNFTQNQIPMVTVAAFFQKEPQVLLAHPGTGVDGFEDLKDKTILLGTDGRLTFWLWLKQTYGLSDDQVKPYTFSPAPFLADRNSVQQGYITSEPFAILQQGGFEPVPLIMADAGYDTYSTTVETSWKLVQEKPDLVQRFIDASAEGWYTYLYGDPSKANALIKEDNAEMSDEQIAYSIEALKRHGIVDSGEALEKGIGVMTKERWDSFFQKAVGWGLYPASLPIEKGYTLQFVGKGAGITVKKQLIGR
jgi:NitT/TauT family transport system substrate-binding protein